MQPSEIRDYFTSTFEFRDVGADGRYLDAVVCTYGNPVDTGRSFLETLRRGVFDETLSRHGKNIKLIVGHDASAPGVATPVKWLREDPQHLGVVYRFGTHEEAHRAAQMAEEGMFGGVSVGFLPGRKPGDNVWTRVDGMPHVERVQARLLHTGMVTQPANADAEMVAVRSAGVPGDVFTPRMVQARMILDRMRRGGSVLEP